VVTFFRISTTEMYPSCCAIDSGVWPFCTQQNIICCIKNISASINYIQAQIQNSVLYIIDLLSLLCQDITLYDATMNKYCIYTCTRELHYIAKKTQHTDNIPCTIMSHWNNHSGNKLLLTLVSASGEALYLRSKLITRTWPCWAAWCSGVYPS